MGQVIKRSGKRQIFSAAKIRRSIQKTARKAKLSPVKTKQLVKEVGDTVIKAYKGKRLVKSTVLRRSILGRLKRKSRAAASVWRRHKKKK